jgi:5-methylcytosine-specific restriction endonuclease McrA
MAKPKKKKVFNPKTKIIPAIRRIWFHSPVRREVLNRAKVDEYFRCEKCRGLQEKVHIDHIDPCVPLTGWEGYDSFIARLFCDPSELQVICEKCHSKKSLEETKIRKENRAKNQPKKSKKDEAVSE